MVPGKDFHNLSFKFNDIFCSIGKVKVLLVNFLFLLSKSGLAITMDEFAEFFDVSDNLIKSLPVVRLLIFISSTSNFLLEGNLIN